jgi:hypothetical protein
VETGRLSEEWRRRVCMLEENFEKNFVQMVQLST